MPKFVPDVPPESVEDRAAIHDNRPHHHVLGAADGPEREDPGLKLLGLSDVTVS